MKKIVVALGVLLLAAGGWYYASPLWTLKAMRHAAVAKDGAALSRYVDYEALRADLKGDLRRSMMAGMAKQPDNPFAAIGMAIALNLVDPMIEAMVSPEGVEAMFASQRNAAGGDRSGDAPANSSSSADAATDAGGGAPRAKPSLAAAAPGDDPEIDRIGLDEFRVRGEGKDPN